jgi:hypothetical protein
MQMNGLNRDVHQRGDTSAHGKFALAFTYTRLKNLYQPKPALNPSDALP